MSSSMIIRVDKATSDLLLGSDWTMNMEICDSINSDPGLVKDVIKAVKKRLQNKSPRVQFLALTLLETMIKNCGDFVHFQVVERDILQEMVKIVRKKSDMEVRDKILVLLDSWQEAFGGSRGNYPQYFWAYADLKRSGVDFPHRPADATLIFTPPTPHTATTRNPHAGYNVHGDSPMRLDQAMSSASCSLSSLEVDQIRSVMELLNDMLKAVNPQDCEAVKDEVIKDLVDQCCSNHKKILQLIESTRDEELLRQWLALNDELQTLLAKHDAMASGSPFPDEASDSVPIQSVPVNSANSFEEEEDDGDDEFAQLARRNSKLNPAFQNTPTGYANASNSTYHANPIDISNESADKVAFSNGSHPLALPNPPPPVKTTTKEQNIINLLAITSPSTSSQPHTPVTSSSTTPFQQNGSPHSLTRTTQRNPQSPQTYSPNQIYFPYSNYITPWAQSHSPSSFHSQSQQLHFQPQVVHHNNYPPPPWEDATNPFAEASYRFQTPSIDAPSNFILPHASTMQYNSSGMKNVANPVVATSSEMQAYMNAGSMGTSVSHKPFVPSYRLFEDLVNASDVDGVVKASKV